MGNLIKLNNKFMITDFDIDLIDSKVIINNIIQKEIIPNCRMDANKVLKSTFHLGKLLDDSIMTKFNQKKLEIKKKYFFDASSLKQNFIIQLTDLIHSDLPADKMLGFIPLYSSLYDELKNEDINYTKEAVLRYVNTKNDIGFTDAFEDIIDVIEKSDIEVSNHVDQLVNLIVVSNGKYSDIQTNILLTSQIVSGIKDYCKNYGLPFWTTRKQFKEIPIDNFIKICILIYRFKNLWDKINQYDENDLGKDFDDFIDMMMQLDIYGCLNTPYGVRPTKNEALIVFLENIISTDVNIRCNYNCIEDFQLTFYRIWNKPFESSMNMRCENEYESLIIAVWDYFYMNYISNTKDNKCSYCGRTIKGEKHSLRGIDYGKILCEECYKKKRKNDNKNNVNTFRKKGTK